MFINAWPSVINLLAFKVNQNSVTLAFFNVGFSRKKIKIKEKIGEGFITVSEVLIRLIIITTKGLISF